MMHNNGHPAHPQQQQQHTYRTHDFSAPPPPPPSRQQMQDLVVHQQQLQMQVQQRDGPFDPEYAEWCRANGAMPIPAPGSARPAPPMPARQATCGATAMSGMAIKPEPESGYRPRSIGRYEPPEDIDPEDLKAANEVVAKVLAEKWRRLEITIEDEVKKQRFHKAAQTLWSVAKFKSRNPADVRDFDDAARHVRATCADRFPGWLGELTAVCPGLTVMEQPKDTQLNRLYYGFDIFKGANFWSIATVDIQLRNYGFDVVNVHRVGFRMVEKANPGDQARYERELAAGLYEYNATLHKRNKELRSAIGKKPTHKATEVSDGKKPLKPSKKAYEVLMHESQARMWDPTGECGIPPARARE